MKKSKTISIFNKTSFYIKNILGKKLEIENIYYTNKNSKNIEVKINLQKINKLSDDEIIKKYGIINNTNYGEIYSFIKSKNKKIRTWPKKLLILKIKIKGEVKKLYSKKNVFIDKDKRLSLYVLFKDNFNNIKTKIKCIVVFPEERNTIIKTIHEGFGHLGINRLDYEIRRRGLY
jgi:hypothetical protein